MKKFLFPFFLLFPFAGISAADHLKVNSGNINLLFCSDKSAHVEFTYDGLKIENKPFKAYAEGRESGYEHTFDKEREVAEEAFKAKWTRKMPKGLRLQDQSYADYTIRIHIQELDLGSNAAALWGLRTADGGALMWGTLTLLDSDGHQLLHVIIEGLRGLGNNGVKIYKEGNRLKKVYEKLAIKLSEKD